MHRLVLVLFILSLGVTAKAEPETYTATQVSENIYVLYANVGVIIGEDYVTLVDSWLGHYQKGATERLVEAVKKLTDKPIRYVINTHSHGDHAGGNGDFLSLGATVIAHKNSIYSPFIPKSGQPKGMLRFDKGFSLDMGDEYLKVEHLVAHTFDDALIYAKQGNVLFAGDNLITRFWVGLGVDGMRSFDTWMNKALGMMDDNTKIVPGHGATIMDRKQLVDYGKAVKAWVNHIERLKNEGLSAKAIVEDNKTKTLFSNLIKDDDSAHGELKLDDVKEIFTALSAKNTVLPVERLSDLVGRYRFDKRNDIEILVENGRLTARQRDKFYTYLNPVGEFMFELSSIGGGEIFEFKRNKAADVTGLTPIIPEKSRYQSLVTGFWPKK